MEIGFPLSVPHYPLISGIHGENVYRAGTGGFMYCQKQGCPVSDREEGKEGKLKCHTSIVGNEDKCLIFYFVPVQHPLCRYCRIYSLGK